VAVLLVCRAVSSRIPGPIVAMLGATVVVYLFKIPVETIGTRFGGIPSGLPHFVIPRWHAGLVHSLLGAGVYGGDAGGDRVAHVGCSF
jgi:SulP family sulfate permease